MPGVIVGMETNQVAVQNTQQQGLSYWENTIDLTAGERCVQEEGNLDILLRVSNFFTQHLGKQHQVVVVDPDEISVLYIVRNSLRKQSVHLAVCAPGPLIECDLAGVVVEEGPENGIC